jgi:hypothetical protein
MKERRFSWERLARRVLASRRRRRSRVSHRRRLAVWRFALCHTCSVGLRSGA